MIVGNRSSSIIPAFGVAGYRSQSERQRVDALDPGMHTNPNFDLGGGQSKPDLKTRANPSQDPRNAPNSRKMQRWHAIMTEPRCDQHGRRDLVQNQVSQQKTMVLMRKLNRPSNNSNRVHLAVMCPCVRKALAWFIIVQTSISGDSMDCTGIFRALCMGHDKFNAKMLLVLLIHSVLAQSQSKFRFNDP